MIRSLIARRRSSGEIDTRMRFSIQPPPGQPSAFDQWKDAMRAVCRLPMGIPAEFRKKVWLSLADHYLVQLRINWDKTLRFVFNERSNPDDDKLGMQIVKDLHRTGCSNFSGDDNVEDRAILKRVLLAYARWNKRVGYCQGFNVIAALLLNVMDRKEDDALKVMIFLIDSVLPESYFANNLRALSVDMAVFRDLLSLTYPRLSKHLDKLQLAAQDVRTGACYEPPLTNVFTMQWFLTLFATCLPVSVVLRVWDSVLLEGSEILLRTALTIWGKLAKQILSVSSADEFYSVMGELSSSIMQGSIMDGDSIIKSIYSLGDFPFPHLNELREKYTYNIRPLTPATSNGTKKVNGGRSLIKAMLYSDDDEMDDDDITAMACMPGEMGGSPASSSSDISVLGPGVYGTSGMDSMGGSKSGGGSMQMERMSTDIHSLKLQYQRLKERQQQAHIIIAAASQKKAQLTSSSKKSSSSSATASSSSSSSRGQRVVSAMPSSILLPSIESPTAMNHLFVGKNNPPSASARNRLVTEGPRISQQAVSPKTSAVLSKQLQAVANAQAVSKSQRMRSSRTRGQHAHSGMSGTSTNTAAVSPTTLPQEQKTVNLSPGDNESPSSSSPADSGDGKECPGKSLSVCLSSSIIEKDTEGLNSNVQDNSMEEKSRDKATLDQSSQIVGKDSENFKSDVQDNSVSKECKEKLSFSQSSQIVEKDQENLNCDVQDKCVQTCFEVTDGTEVEYLCVNKSAQDDDSICSKDEEVVDLQVKNSFSRTSSDLHDISALQCVQDIPDQVPYLKDKSVVSKSPATDCGVSISNSHSSPLSEPNIPEPTTKADSSSLTVFPIPLLHSESVPDDSGIDSSSTPSPYTTPRKKVDSTAVGLECVKSELWENQESKLDQEEILSVTASSLNDEMQVCFQQEAEDLQSYLSLKSDIETIEDKNNDNAGNLVIDLEGDSVPCITSVDNEEKYATESQNDSSVMTCDKERNEVFEDASTHNSQDLPSVWNITTATSPQKKFFHSPSSPSGDSYVLSPGLIETISIPENVDKVSETHEFISSPSVKENVHTGSSSSPRQSTEELPRMRRNSVRQVTTSSILPAEKEDKGKRVKVTKANSTGTSNTDLNIRRYSTPSSLIVQGSHMTTDGGFKTSSTSKPFNPFPVKLFNANRAKTGLKLGLYTATTLEQLKGLKPRTTST